MEWPDASFSDLLQRAAAEHDREVAELRAEVRRQQGGAASPATPLVAASPRRASVPTTFGDRRAAQAAGAGAGRAPGERLEAIEDTLQQILSHMAPQRMPQEVPLTRRSSVVSACSISTAGGLESTFGDPLETEQMLSLPENWPMSVKLREGFQKEDTGKSMRKYLSRKPTLRQIHALTFIRSVSEETQDDRLPARGWLRWATRRLMMSPSSKLRVLWDLLGVIMLATDLTFTPFSLAWDLKYEGFPKVAAWVLVGFWSLDVLANCFTGFYEDGEVVMEFRLMVRRYIRTFLVFDVTAVSCDWTLIILNSMRMDSSGSTTVFKTLRLYKVTWALRLIRVVRMSKFLDIMHRISDRYDIPPGFEVIWDVLKLLAVLLWVNHVMACIWYAVGRWADADTGTHWINQPIVSGRQSNGLAYQDIGDTYLYFTAFHWSLAQMTPGSMKVDAVNSFERLVNIFCLVCGVMVFSSLISLLSAKLTHNIMLKQGLNSKMQLVRRFLQQSKVSSGLGIQIQKQLRERLEDKRQLTMQEVDSFGKLSLSLRTKLEMELYMHHIFAQPVLIICNMVDRQSIRDLCHKAVKFQVLPKSDNLFLPGIRAVAAYQHVQGRLVYTQEPSSSKVLEKTETALERPGTWLSELAVWTEDWTHVGQVEAITTCKLLAIDASEYVGVLMGHHLISDFVSEFAQKFHELLHASGRSSSRRSSGTALGLSPGAQPQRWPNDLGVPGADFANILSTMSKSSRTFSSLLVLERSVRDRLEAGTFGGWGSENGRSGAFERFTLALEHEINEGRFYLEPMVNGDVVCVTPTIGLRLVNDEGQVLLQLGKWSSSRVHVHGRLPSIVRRPEERLVDAFGRLTEGKLAPFMGQFEETFTEEVDKLGRDIHATFRTRYLQVIQHACLSGSEWQQRMRRMSNSAAGGADPSVPASLSPAAGRRGELTRMSTSTSDFCDASQALRESPSRGNGRKLTIGQGSSSSGAITSSGAIASSSTRGSICRDARSSRGAIGRDISTMESGGSWASASQNVGGLARLLTRLSGRATALGGVGHAERQHETAGRPDMYAHRHEECIYVFAFVPEDLAEAICRGEDHADEIVSLWMNGVALDERPSDAFDGALSSPSASRPAGANSATASSGASHTQASEPLSPGLRVGSPSGSSRASPSSLASAASRAAAQDDGARWRLSSATSELRLTFASEDSDKGSEGSRVCI